MSNIDDQVCRQIDRLKSKSLREIEGETAEKRIKWYQRHAGKPVGMRKPSPRLAYELLTSAYLGLSEAEVPVLAESDTEIEWLSNNACPTLEACKELGLNTRQVCRAAYEKSTQALLSQLDPHLRFYRSYDEIRPFSDACREKIVRVDFEEMMTVAVEEAIVSRRKGNKGYGAVVFFENRIVGQAHDTAVTDRDPSRHAEVNAIRQAVRVLDDTNLSGAILFSTCEPCPMCASLAVWSNLTTIVYGVSIEETVRLGKKRIQISSNEIAEKSPVMIEVIWDILHDECLALYT